MDDKEQKVLVILNRLDIGGTSINTIPLISLMKQNFTVKILYGEKDSENGIVQYFRTQYPNLVLTPIKSLQKRKSFISLLKAYLQISKEIKWFKPTIVHTHGSLSGIIGRFSAKNNNVSVIVHTYHGHFFHSYFSTATTKLIIVLEQIIAKFTDKIIVLSGQQKEDIVNNYKITTGSKTTIIPLGIHQQYFSNQSTQKRVFFRNKFLVDDDTVAIGLIGRLVPIKNPFFFIEVCTQLKKVTQQKLLFFIVGDGELIKPLQLFLTTQQIPFSSPEIINKNPLFIFTSWYTNIAEVHHGLDIVALTSLNEGTPLSLIEAQYCGKPIIATNVGGVKDAVIDGETGFLLNKGDSHGFVEKLTLLVNDADLRNSMGSNAHNFIKEMSSSEKQLEATIELYTSLISKKTKPF
ncbi:MAG: glycosyltransferase [Pedobacter sp.]|nr:glycosyltransferase [Chitinophagaceae bacterium]